jgi:N-methylhydantoinase B
MALDSISVGEVCVTRATGGGGWGTPLDRDPRRVREDVLDGLISRERARNVYGVVLDTTGANVDEAVTDALRRRMAAAEVGLHSGERPASRQI